MSRQIVPKALDEIMTRPDGAGKARAMQAMMGMHKLEIKGTLLRACRLAPETEAQERRECGIVWA